MNARDSYENGAVLEGKGGPGVERPEKPEWSVKEHSEVFLKSQNGNDGQKLLDRPGRTNYTRIGYGSLCHVLDDGGLRADGGQRRCSPVGSSGRFRPPGTR